MTTTQKLEDLRRMAVKPLSRAARYALRKGRIERFRWMSSIRLNNATVISPVLAVGVGSISVDGSRLGFWPSPLLFDACIYLEARTPDSRISIGHGTTINNGATIISEGPGVFIGNDCLVGPGATLYDSDFHGLDQSDRVSSPKQGRVRIGDRCFIGANVTVCKGVTIGQDSVIGAGSIVTSDIPSHAIAAGNPCRVIRLGVGGHISADEEEGPSSR